MNRTFAKPPRIFHAKAGLKIVLPAFFSKASDLASTYIPSFQRSMSALSTATPRLQQQQPLVAQQVVDQRQDLLGQPVFPSK